MKKNMSFKIIATVGLWAAIGLTACKAPQLSPDGERAVLPEGDGHTYDTAFVKPLECVFPGFHLTRICGGRFAE